MTKTYKHPVLGREATLVMLGDHPCGYTCKELGANILGNERAIEALGFIETPIATIKKLPEKFENIYPGDPDVCSKRKINELIDHLTPEAPIDTEEKRDWIDDAYNDYKDSLIKPSDWYKQIFRNVIEKNIPKPVEQELSKYGVHKQEEKKPDITKVTREQIDNWCDRCCGVVPQYVENAKNAIKCFIKFQTSSYRDTPNPQATSVDVEEDKIETIVQDLRECMVTKPIGVRGGGIVSMVEIREIVKKHLSSLPIQKKRSEEEILERCRNNMADEIEVIQFCKAFNLLSD